MFNVSLNKHKRSLEDGRMRGKSHEWRTVEFWEVKDTDKPVRTALNGRAGWMASLETFPRKRVTWINTDQV